MQATATVDQRRQCLVFDTHVAELLVYTPKDNKVSSTRQQHQQLSIRLRLKPQGAYQLILQAIMPDVDQTPEVKTRTRKAATARKTARKPAARDAIPQTPSKNTQASEAHTAKSRHQSRKPEVDEVPETAFYKEFETPLPIMAPELSNMSGRDTTPHMSGRLGSRLTGTHAALPAQSGSFARQVAP